MFKVCTKCGLEKSVDEFYRDYRYKDTVRYKSICKSCWHDRQQEYRKTHKQQISESGKIYYQNHKQSINQRTKQWQIDNRERILDRQRIKRIPFKEKLFQLKTSCVKCGESRPWLLQFHHVNPNDKSFEITQTTLMRYDDETIDLEVQKCICLCCNCHTEFHFFYGKKPKNPEKDLDDYLKGIECCE